MEKRVSYYSEAFKRLTKAGVPFWYIRLYLLDDLICFSKVYVYYNPYDETAENGWYSTNGICSINPTPADFNRNYYGVLKSMGFPDWDDYKMLFDGDEYDSPSEFMNAYEEHQEEWLLERQKIRSRTDYSY